MPHRIKGFFTGNAIWILLIAFVAAIGFWPVLSGMYPLKWDAMDYYFPSRHLLSQYISEGNIPFWCPYQNLGYPMYADPQSGFWYPVSIVLASVSRYPLWMIGFEFVLHVAIAGWGMFYLVRRFRIKNGPAFLAAVAYMMCGVFVSNAQHLTWIISAAWLPVVVNAFILLLRHPVLRNALFFALAFFMMFSGGYPAFAFILVYLLLALWIVNIIRLFRNGTKDHFWQLIQYSALAILFFVLMSAFIFVSEYQVLSWMSRGEGTTLQMALFGPFSVESFISFLSPYSVALSDFSSLNTDLSMANANFGTFALLFFIAGIFVRKKHEISTIFWFGLVALTASVGSALPVREFFYYYLPALNLFRFPAVFRLSFIFGAVIVAALAANRFVFEKKQFPPALKILFIVSLIISAISLVLIRANNYLSLRQFISTDLFHFSLTSTLHQHLAIDLILLIIMLGLSVFLIIKNSKTIAVFRIILVFSSLQMIFSVRTNAPYTVYSEDVMFSEANVFVNQFPDSFPALSKSSVLQNEQLAPRQSPFWRNLNLFNRQVAADGFTPFKSAGFEHLQDSLPGFLQLIIKNPTAYFSRNIEKPEAIKISGKTFEDSSLVAADVPESINWKLDSSLWENKIIGIHFAPNRIEFEVSTNLAALLILQQNHHIGWKASIDGEPIEIKNVNFTEMGIVVPEGEHAVVFSFEPPMIRSVLLVSFISILLVFILWILLSIRKNQIK